MAAGDSGRGTCQSPAASLFHGNASRPDVAMLTSWNLEVSRDQIAPTLFNAWAPALYRRAIARETVGMGSVASMLAARPSYEWLEKYLQLHAGTPALDSLVMASVDSATAEVKGRFGVDQSQWQWGIETCRRLGDYAAKKKVDLALELEPFRLSLLNNIDSMARFIDESLEKE